jgi:hypothetical protein
MTKLNKRIGFLGAGQMAEALARGLMNKGVVTGDQICCNDPWAVRRDVFKSFGAVPYESNIDVRPPPLPDRRCCPAAAATPRHRCRHRRPPQAASAAPSTDARPRPGGRRWPRTRT